MYKINMTRAVCFSVAVLLFSLQPCARAASPVHRQPATPLAALPLPTEAVPSFLSPVLPIVIWHGMGDTCCNPESIGYLRDYLEKRYGTYVHSINSGSGSAWSDFLSGFYGSVNDQVARACEQLRADRKLAGGFNLLGFSQGGQFARALVQRCGHVGLRVRSLITFGAQHGGIVDVPGCSSASMNATETGVCKAAMDALGTGAYLPYVRDHIVQAQYFKSPSNLEGYFQHNPFLPDINNEVAARRTEQYRDNLLALDRFVMVRFAEDSTGLLPL